MDTPSLAEALRMSLDARAGQIRTALPCRIVATYLSQQTVDVRPEVWPTGEEPPVISNVPVVWPRGGGGYLVFPLVAQSKFDAGDTGLLLCCEADITEWRRTGQAGPPADAAQHHLQNAVFLPGLVPRGEEVQALAGRTILAGAGDLRLGAWNASHALLFGDSYATALSNFLASFQIWTLAVSVATGVPCAGINAAANTLDAATSAALSTSVKTT